jgi:glycine cleavage system H protein
MNTPNNRYYSSDHEWITVQQNQATIGITDFAQRSLGDVVFVELPQPEAVLSAGDVLGVVESVKAASEVYTPVSGRVVAINEILEDEPERLNEEPYDAWIAVLELSDPNELDALMNEAAYQDYCKQEDA